MNILNHYHLFNRVQTTFCICVNYLRHECSENRLFASKRPHCTNLLRLRMFGSLSAWKVLGPGARVDVDSIDYNGFDCLSWQLFDSYESWTLGRFGDFQVVLSYFNIIK